MVTPPVLTLQKVSESKLAGMHGFYLGPDFEMFVSFSSDALSSSLSLFSCSQSLAAPSSLALSLSLNVGQ